MNGLTERYTIDLMRRSAGETAARSLDVINAIEQTIDMLRWVSDRANADANFLTQEADKIKSADPLNAIDSDDDLCKSLESVQDSVGDSYKLFNAKRNAALKAPELKADDGVVDAYTEAITSLGDLYDALNSIRWAISIHDSILESPASEPTSDIDSLLGLTSDKNN
ncbi:MAG: hypothetical protein PHV02_12110 [Rhodocyclaceae bacterium]|nr:hypothetical protein [Rhodocyclaceae bacterium]